MALGMNYSTAGFELILTRKMSFYIITYYLPSGLFVGISWVRWEMLSEINCDPAVIIKHANNKNKS